jgi:SAM-dependent methyltransferase
MSDIPRWFSDTEEGHSLWYIERFRAMAREGTDLAGEARLIDAIVTPGSRLLDAGCGPGRVGGELFRRGHQVVGVDVDPELIAAAVEDHPGPTWLVEDLAALDLAAAGHPEPFDAAVVAGNVMTFLAAGTEAEVLRRLGRHVRPDGQIVIGFGLDRGYAIGQFDADIAAAGLIVEQRFATWDLRPFTPESGFAVTILRVP